jgi:hypothetical protein
MDERFLTVVTRTTLTAALLGLGLLIALPRHASFLIDFVDAFTVAFCFTFLGHYVDALLLALPGIRSAAGHLVRAAGWFAGGLWCYVIARWLWIRYGRDPAELPGLLWGGVFLVTWELAMNRVVRRDAAASSVTGARHR